MTVASSSGLLVADASLFENIFHSASAGMLLIDPDDAIIPYRVVLCNEEAARMNGYRRDELEGQSMFLIATEATAEGMRGGVEALRRGESAIGIGDHRRKDGSVYPVAFSLSLIRHDGKEYVLGVDRDVSQRQRLIEQLKEEHRASVEAKQRLEGALRAKSQYMAMLSHDIRLPLNSIAGFSEILTSTNLDGEQRDYVEDIRRAGDSILKLVDSLLELSRLEAGEFSPEPVESDLRKVVENAIRLLIPQASERGIGLEAVVSSSVPASLRLDSKALSRVLTNLLGNAVKFTETGGVTLSLEYHEPLLEFSVRDTGKGIPSDELPHVFEPFRQGRAAREFDGSVGLGLAISRELIRRMGGDIRVEATSAAGTEFKFTVKASAV